MSSLGKSAGLSDAEFADLQYRIELFSSSWKADGTTAPESYLPPPGSRHRSHTLVELLKIDMEQRARAMLPFRVESYLSRLPADLSAGTVPISLIVEEYRLRHLYDDQPEFAEYKARFPALADELRGELGTLPQKTQAAPPPAPPGATPGGAAATVQSSMGKELRTLPTPGGGRPPVADAAPPANDDILPADVGYRLLKKLGMGAYGEVFEARAPGGFRVAVKRILRDANHPASQSEAESLEVMKAMSHPFLIQTHAFWVFRDRLVIVMELADGSLAGEIERYKKAGLHGVPPEELVPFFEQAAQALDYLHSQRVTHRDVKPENLLLLKGYAKVADFGLAREHEHDETAVVAEVGTPLYMAPEVWKRNVNLHSDQYSLAATYVTARLGRPIFPAKTLFDLCYMHVNDTPDLDPLPLEEQEVLLKAMAKKPENRYPSCAAFAKALRAAVFPPPPVAVRRRTALWVGLVAGFGAAGALVARMSQPDPQPSVPPPVVPPVVPPPPPPPPWKPVNWDAAPNTEIETVGDRRLYKRLVRTVGGEELVAILIPPARDSDPPPFYMLRDKITNRVFKAAWDAADASTDSRLNWFRKVLPPNDPEVVARYLPGDWKKDRTEFDGKPVLGVNAVEAILVAQQLGGEVPTYAQWLKAVGANGDDTRPGPAGDKEQPGEVLANRPLALGLVAGDRPWLVSTRTVDVSVYGIHQLVSNGYEWADGRTEDKRTDLRTLPAGGLELPLTGMPYENSDVLTFARIRTRNPMEDWLLTREGAGFRVVLVPK